MHNEESKAMALIPKIRQQLKAKAHKLSPIVFIGNQGLTDNVNKEIDRALTDHELIKIRIIAEDREARRALYQEIGAAHGAELLQLIGNIGIIYRKND